MKKRCQWCGDDPLYCAYHDEEWGVPLHDDRRLFELLCLEGAQAGLSWITILKKRHNYRKAFDDFDPVKMARYNAKKTAELLNNPGIVRNKLKVNGFVKNARAYLSMLESGDTLDGYLWQYTDGQPLQNRWVTLGHPGDHAVVGPTQPGLEEKGLHLRGRHHLLRLHAGRRAGQ